MRKLNNLTVFLVALLAAIPQGMVHVAAAQTPATVPTTMQQLRGNVAHIPTLADGQFFVAAPSGSPGAYNALWVGSPTGNIDLTIGGGSGGVPSVNGITSAVSLIAGTGLNLAVSGGNITFANTGVTAFNSLVGGVSLVAGTNVSLSTSGNTITINASSSGSAGVPSVNSITGAVTIAGGTGVSVGTSGSTITINATGGGGSAVSSFNTGTGAITLSGTSGQLSVSTAGAANQVQLSPSGVTAGSYTSPNLTVDTYGRITTATNGNTPTLPLYTVALLMGKTPSGAGADTYEFVMPYGIGGATLTYTLAAQHLRLGTSGSSPTYLYINYHAATSAFSTDGSFGGITVTSGNNESTGGGSAPIATPGVTIQSGGKIRAFIGNLGAGAANITYEVEFTCS